MLKTIELRKDNDDDADAQNSVVAEARDNIRLNFAGADAQADGHPSLEQEPQESSRASHHYRYRRGCGLTWFCHQGPFVNINFLFVSFTLGDSGDIETKEENWWEIFRMVLEMIYFYHFFMPRVRQILEIAD